MGCTDCNELNQGPKGYDGWSPTFSVVEDAVNLDTDDNTRSVLQLNSWVGGEGITPTIHIGEYVSGAGYTSTIASATNIRGAQDFESYKLSSTDTFTLPVVGTTISFNVDKPEDKTSYSIGARVRVSSATTPTVDYFEGVVTDYTGIYFEVAVDISTNTGNSFNSWNVNLAAESYLSTNLKAYTDTVLSNITLTAGTLPNAFSDEETILNLTPSGNVPVPLAKISLICQGNTNNSNNVIGGGTIAPYNKLFIDILLYIRKNGNIIKTQGLTVIDNGSSSVFSLIAITDYTPGDVFTVTGKTKESSITLIYDVVATISNAFLIIENY